jgi:hypothetical protein
MMPCPDAPKICLVKSRSDRFCDSVIFSGIDLHEGDRNDDHLIRRGVAILPCSVESDFRRS